MEQKCAPHAHAYTWIHPHSWARRTRHKIDHSKVTIWSATHTHTHTATILLTFVLILLHFAFFSGIPNSRFGPSKEPFFSRLRRSRSVSFVVVRRGLWVSDETKTVGFCFENRISSMNNGDRVCVCMQWNKRCVHLVAFVKGSGSQTASGKRNPFFTFSFPMDSFEYQISNFICPKTNILNCRCDE